MTFRQVDAFFLVGALLLAGCVNSPRPAEAPLAAAMPALTAVDTPLATAAPVRTESLAASSAVEPVAYKKPVAAPRPKTAGPALKPGEYALMVESEPDGATVVVNGKPCGKTPCRVVLQANRRGFLREQVSIKVRFIATNEAQSSQTVEDVLTTLDKVPS